MIDYTAVESVFFTALDKPAGPERAAFLDEACGDNAEMRRHVERMLDAHPQAAGFLEEPARDLFATLDVPPITEKPGSMIGPYKLKEQIGEGGFGLVFVAEQQEPVKRKVAIKVIKPGKDTREVMARFVAERQALALMDHPNIARVLDAGATDSGRPYFVMELVRGIPITDYCDQNQLSPRDRMELFVTVCQAVQHAHQKGIIHRDIKPSNVLVTSHDGKPVAKVIDFGVAKAINQQLTERSIYTNFAQMIGTPLYMSPEQAEMSGLDVDTRSDIYSLGVLLYELLTGTTPLEKKKIAKAAYDEIRRMIREEEPPMPSTRLSTSESIASIAAHRHTEPSKLSKLVRGDLDWITMKALEKDRTRRYETANGLARDVQRHLSDEPVEACPPSATYRLRKFAKKNRAALTTAAALALLLVAGVGVSTWQAVRATRAEVVALEAQQAERERAEGERLARLDAMEKEKLAVEQRARAERARDRTRDVLDAMTSTVTGDSLATQKEISADQKKFLSEVLTYYREFAGEKADDEKTRARTADAAFRVGRIEERLGQKEQAIAAYQLARDGYQKLAADFPAVPVHRVGQAMSHINLGNLLKVLGKHAEEEEQYRQALAIFEKLVADFPTVTDYRLGQAQAHNNLGTLLAGLGKQVEAGEQYRQGLAIFEKLAADFPTVPGYRRDLAGSHNNLGGLQKDLGKRTEAAEQHGQALAILEKLAGDFPTMPDYRQELAHIHDNLGQLLAEQKKGTEAEEQFRQALAIQEKLAADFPAVPDYRWAQAGHHNNLGAHLANLGRRTEAEVQHRQALAIQEKLAADFPALPDYRRALALSHLNLGNRLYDRGKLAEAEEQYRQALAIQEKLAADFPAAPVYRQDLALSHANLGTLLKDIRKLAEAEEQYRQALAIQEKLATDFPAEPDYRLGQARAHNALGVLLAPWGKRTEAEEQYRKGLAISEKLATDYPALPAYQIDLGGGFCNYGNLVLNNGRASESLAWFNKAIATLAPVHRAEPRDVIAKQYLCASHGGRAMAYDQIMKHAEALQDWDRAIELSNPAQRLILRASRATSWIVGGKVAEAVAEVAELTKSSNWNEGQWYDFACAYSIASGKMADKKQAYADRAMELLQKAVKSGFTHVAHMKKDTDLDPLREREDFKKLIAGLEKKAEPDFKP
jgi:eukaryotic-like serine/threonine-protein kinase